MSLSLKTRRYIMFGCLVAFACLATAVVLYSEGYNWDKKLGLSLRGGLYISTPFSNSKIFINNKEEKTTGFLSKSLFKSNVKTGSYAVLVAKDGFWPWAKTLKVREGMVAEARAIMVPENPKGEKLQKGRFFDLWSSPLSTVVALKEKAKDFYTLTFYQPDKNIYLLPTSKLSKHLLTFKDDITPLKRAEDYFIFKSEKGLIKASFDFSNNTVAAQYSNEIFENSASAKYEKFTDRKREQIWWNPTSNQVFVDWTQENRTPPYYICEKNCNNLPIQIFQSKLPIRKIDFFPQRKDVIIIAVGNGVYALEIDGRGGRLIYPIYKGKNPTFGLSNSSDYIYVLDDGSLMKIYLK